MLIELFTLARYWLNPLMPLLTSFLSKLFRKLIWL